MERRKTIEDREREIRANLDLEKEKRAAEKRAKVGKYELRS